jgi:protein phosphatase
MNILISAGVCTHVGRVRNNNEDNFFLNGSIYERRSEKKGFVRCQDSADDVQLYAVCDGMGGQAAGEEASALGVSLMRKLLEDLRTGEDIHTAMDRYVALANGAVTALRNDAGSTLVVLCVRENIATVAWLGDSRAYLLREGKLLLLTEDHTEEQRMLKMGLRIPGNRARNSLTRYLGMDMPGLVVTPSYVQDIELKKHDVFLLCSDGLTNLVDEAKIKTILDEAEIPERDLAEEALAAGGIDNVTALVLDVTKLSKPLGLFGAKKT